MVLLTPFKPKNSTKTWLSSPSKTFSKLVLFRSSLGWWLPKMTFENSKTCFSSLTPPQTASFPWKNSKQAWSSLSGSLQLPLTGKNWSSSWIQTVTGRSTMRSLLLRRSTDGEFWTRRIWKPRSRYLTKTEMARSPSKNYGKSSTRLTTAFLMRTWKSC